MHQNIGASALYSSALIYLTQSNATGNLLRSANSIHSRVEQKNASDVLFFFVFFPPPLKNIPAGLTWMNVAIESQPKQCIWL